jgi:UDP-3-O-[3-hydroxymyristoyl] glucosamine N-acyltransferase
MPFTADEIARHLGGNVQGDGSTLLTGFAPAQTARPGDLTFAENEKYFAAAEKSAAAAILVDGAFSTTSGKIIIRVPSARLAFARVLPLFFPATVFAPGIHPSAVVAKSAQIAPTAHIGPACVIGENTRIGARSVLESGNHIGANCRLGEDVHLFPNVVIYPRSQIGNRVSIHAGSVIGSDGYGYVFDGTAHVKVPQIGNVIIHDDVELGANVTVDRGALGSTIIGKGTKIDNLVQVAHNVIIGEHCLLVSHAAVAGSARLGNYVTLAGQAGIAGHLQIGDRVIVAGQSGVMNNIPAGERWLGTPAQPDRAMKRQWVAMRNLPELLHRLNDLEKRLAHLEGEKK